VRADFNVPLTKGDKPEVTDDTRLRGAVPTIKYLTERGAKVVLASHLGRPDGKASSKYSLSHVTPRLSSLVGQTVKQLDDCKGPKVSSAVSSMKNGEIVMLENVRFYAEEEKNDDKFSAELASNADVFVNDAFGTAHRAHASTAGIAKHLKTSVAGFLMQKELQYLQGVVDKPNRPFVAIVGGSKVSSKISVIESLLNKVNKLVLGGGMVFTFLKARGVNVGASLVENDQLELARTLEKKAKEKGVQLFLAKDVVIADKFAADASFKTVDVNAIPDGWMGLDIGPQSIADIRAGLADAKTIIWNGPLGVFEFDNFAKGTNEIAKMIAELTRTKGTVSVVGGGDSVAAVEKAGWWR
jgi:phosphoglycerate kinase